MALTVSGRLHFGVIVVVPVTSPLAGLPMRKLISHGSGFQNEVQDDPLCYRKNILGHSFVCFYVSKEKNLSFFLYFASGSTQAPIFMAVSVITKGAPRYAGLDNGALVWHVAMYYNSLIASPCKQDLKTLSTKSIKNLYSFFTDI